ncbi:pyridoxamine 5'-phosphate oxidase family protein [Streptomyces sp. NPDC050560]|uniref:pyridoxamine 5'-phosphate oxidase family protein n=1 Tax=Streptomyces sp. NPDC050560 TaxID=3365630 RepID=UPI0037AE4213
MPKYLHNPRDPDPAYREFWRERRLCTLTTLRADGSPHVVPVGATYDPAQATARVIASGTSAKVRHVLAATGAGERARVAVCQFEGRRWATLEGYATIRTEPELIADGERRYEERYGRPPRPNARRVLIEIAVTAALGTR